MQRGKPLRVIVIGAHPDDCEYYCGGTAAKLAAAGHQVKFVSLTCGDAGHHLISGQELSDRRTREAQEAARRLGISAYDVLPYRDGRLMPTLDARETVIRLIRNWQADVVFTHRPNDYHPDHRITSLLVQDSAYLVMVPNLCRDTPALRWNPIYLYFEDDFRKPNPFTPDIAVAIDDVWERKLLALDAHESQFYEWLPWVDWGEEVPPQTRAARLDWLSGKVARPIREPVRAALARRYGEERATRIRFAEAFELCEYGRQASWEELDALMPR